MRLLQECAGCGCTDDYACLSPEGQVCSWVSWDLCSACADRGGRLQHIDSWVEAHVGRLALVVAAWVLIVSVPRS